MQHRRKRERNHKREERVCRRRQDKRAARKRMVWHDQHAKQRGKKNALLGDLVEEREPANERRGLYGVQKECNGDPAACICVVARANYYSRGSFSGAMQWNKAKERNAVQGHENPLRPQTHAINRLQAGCGPA
eukprot:5612473-Pleurochrysis_carterae.AAC.1